MPMPKTIYVTEGAARLVGGTITETTGQDISADPIMIALGPYAPPPNKTDAVTPDVDEPGANDAQRVVKMLIDERAEAAERQYLWAWITDQVEIEPIRLDGPINIR